MSMARLPHLHWICWQPTPYNDFLFRSLAADPEITLTVHFMESVVPSHPWQSTMTTGFSSRIYRRILGLDWHLLRLAALDSHNFFVIGGWQDPTIIAVINLLILLQRPFAIWTDTPDVNRTRSSMRALLRKAWLQRIFNHASYMMGTGVHALSILEKMGCPSYKLINFPFFVDLDLFVPVTEYIQPETDELVVFLSCGRLVNSHKGYDIAIKALGLLQSKAVLNNFIYRIAGVGPDKAVLESLAKEVDIFENLEFTGWLEPQELPHFYRSGHVFLHPSHFDPYANAVLEAMACGLPVIGSDQAGSAVDRIEHMKNGVIHRANNVEDLAGKIIDILSHNEILSIIGAEARRTAELWHVSRGVEIIKSMIENILR